MTDYDPATHGDVDIIFAGGGTAACVAAGRLAKHNPDLRILLIERGPNSFENPAVRNPVLYPTHLLPDSKTALFWQAQPSEHLNKRAVVVPSGGTLGGGSAINFMMYTRAQRVDYDSWNTPGWAADDLIPLSNKVETYHNDNPGVDQTKHGHEGPIHISDGGFRSDSAAEFLATVKQMGKHDIADMEQFDNTVNCFSTWQRYVSKDGKRQDAAFTYLYPLAQGGQHPNLFIRTDAEVVRILFDKSSGGAPRAEGVQYRLRQEDGQGELVTVSAKKLVVASAGALGTPLLLERSGVGSAEVLKKANIPQVAEVAGVGETYQDHHLILYPYKVSLPPDQTVDGLLSGRQDMAAAISSKIPIVGWNAIDICSKLRMTDEEVKAQPERFQKLWQRDFVGGAFESRPLMLLGVVSGFLGDHSNIDANQHIMMGCYTGYPWSRGSIHTKSADSLTDYDFDSGFFSDESDVNTQIWGYKISREITRRLPYSIGELEIGHPKFKEGSPAKLSDADYNKSGSEVADIVYSAEDDAAIEAWVRDNVNTTWHSLGTCAMRPQADGGVVDANLNVYGTKGLKIADLSMVPENVGANTNNTALTVGEKAATIIAAELGVAI